MVGKDYLGHFSFILLCPWPLQVFRDRPDLPERGAPTRVRPAIVGHQVPDPGAREIWQSSWEDGQNPGRGIADSLDASEFGTYVAGGVRHSAVEAVLIVLVGDNDAGAFGTYTQAGD
jgi:hypothetical protein